MPTPRAEVYKWPSWLEVSVVDGYGITPEDRRQTSDFEIGNLLRVLFNTDETTAACTLILDPFAANWFEAFERDVLVQGSRWFWFPLWVGGQVVDHLVRFKTRPQLATREVGDAGYAHYTFELHIGKRQGLMEDEWVRYWIENDPYIFLAASDKLQHCVNVDYVKSLPFALKKGEL